MVESANYSIKYEEEAEDEIKTLLNKSKVFQKKNTNLNNFNNSSSLV